MSRQNITHKPGDDAAMMTAVQIDAPSAPARLVQVPIPKLRPRHVLVAVYAAGVNRADIMQRNGHYPPPPGASETLGLEIAGRITAIGAGVRGFAPGDEVCALVSGGGYASVCLVPASSCLPVPDLPGGHGVDRLSQAACLPEACLTVWRNLVELGQLRAGQRLLLHGGNSGIGTIAIQVARLLGAEIAVTARGKKKCDACRRLGADLVIDTQREDFTEVLTATWGKRPIDLVIDMLGGDILARNLVTLKTGGRHISIAMATGGAAQVPLGLVLRHRLCLIGSVLRSLPQADKARLTRAVRTHLWGAISRGELRPIIEKTLPLEMVDKAHKMMDMPDHVGKIALIMSPHAMSSRAMPSRGS
ncbi:MAG: NAD(P)H-quinone oxidoreductase [Pseudomonadota bacterium]